MAVFRVEKNKDYTTMSNFHLKDKKLSLKAKGLLSQMLSLPEDWDYTLTGLAKINQEGVDAIRTAVKELEAAGYIRREFARRSSGAFDGNVYLIFERPEGQPLLDNPTTVKPDKKEAPLLDYPLSANPLSDNPTQLSINVLSTNKTPYSPQGGAPSDLMFDRFWAAYPKKVNRIKAKKAWDKLKPDRATIFAMAAGLDQYKKSDDWQRDSGKFIPHPATWLNNRRWTDEGIGAAAADGGGRVVEREDVPTW